jgi:CheY-like chemotaxis protein
MLFVNDEGSVRIAYACQFAPDFIFEEAENGLMALQMIASNPRDHYDVIILDTNMPIMDGFEACLRIFNYYKDEHIEQALADDFASLLKSYHNQHEEKKSMSSDDSPVEDTNGYRP